MTPEQQAAYNILPPGGINTPTPFWKMVPRKSVVNRPYVNKFAYSRVDPEIQRQSTQSMRELMSGMASSGGLRFGTAGRKQQQLADHYSRQRHEMAQPFIQSGMQRLSDYYNELEREYYQDPNAFEYKPIKLDNFLGY